MDETEIPKKPVLTEVQLSFVTLVTQHWLTKSELMTAAACRELYGLPEDDFKKFMATPLVKDALEERGVELPKIDLTTKTEWASKSLTPVQLIVANTMLDLIDTRSNKKKLQDLGVSTAKYQSWLKDPKFQSYMRERAEALLGDNEHEVYLALNDKAASGDVKAIELILEMRGIYTRASARNTAANSQLDVQGLLINIIEIISDEVHDPHVAARISERLKTLGENRQTAMGIMEAHEIVQPKVAKARELSPAMKALQESGAVHNG